jgi:cell division septal protein FtsQ
VSEVLGVYEGTTPLRRTLPPSRRRKRSGLAGLFAGALLRAVLLVGVPAAVLVWILYSPYFAIAEVEVDGGSRVSAAWVRENLEPLSGRHILGVSLEAVRRRLSDHPWVASVELRRELPDRLRVVVVERQPAALLAGEGGALTFLDAAGEPIAPCCPGGARGPAERGIRQTGPAERGIGERGLLVVHYPFSGPVPVGEALDLVAELQRVEPAWGAGVREVRILGEEEYRLAVEPLPFPLLVKAGAVSEGVANLRRVLPEVTRRWRGIGSVDLRLPRRIVVQHAGEVVAKAAPAATAAQPGVAASGAPVEAEGIDVAEAATAAAAAPGAAATAPSAPAAPATTTPRGHIQIERATPPAAPTTAAPALPAIPAPTALPGRAHGQS